MMLLVTLLPLQTVPGPREPPPLELTMSVFRDPVAPYATDNSTFNAQLGKVYDDYLKPIVEVSEEVRV